MPVAAIVGGALAAGGAIIASSNNSKAINKSTAAQQQGNNASLALQADIYGQNKGALAPFMARGNAAGDQINALLGLGGTGPTYNPAYGYGVADGQAGYGTPALGQPSPQQAATNAYEIFKQSTGYQSRLNQGMSALSATFAGRGMSQSGAAIKSALRYGQDYASNEFGNYMGYLSNQQGVGLSGASALAGVGQSYASNVTNLNSQNAQFLGQAAVARANNNNQMWGGILGGVGQAVSAFGNASSYAPAAAPMGYGIPATTPSWAPRGF